MFAEVDLCLCKSWVIPNGINPHYAQTNLPNPHSPMHRLQPLHHSTPRLLADGRRQVDDRYMTDWARLTCNSIFSPNGVEMDYSRLTPYPQSPDSRVCRQSRAHTRFAASPDCPATSSTLTARGSSASSAAALARSWLTGAICGGGSAAADGLGGGKSRLSACENLARRATAYPPTPRIRAFSHGRVRVAHPSDPLREPFAPARR